MVRIGDTARPARSRTLAASLVLVDRGIDLLGLMLLAAIAATIATCSGAARGPVPPSALWSGFAAALAISAPAVLAPRMVERLLRLFRVLHPVVVPMSFLVQMLPISRSTGFGVREATFPYYFTRIGLPIETAWALVGAGLVMVFSLSGRPSM